ncbi:MAG: hypothetical protein P1U56_08265 [Saprospiraceae bacterium]|nr:hypothetical protein [Saprospiraceae bacterium]
MSNQNILFLLSVLIVIVFNACQKDNTFEGTNPSITASLDTLTFDTVFTTIGSATRSFKIFNNENEDILIDVALQNGQNSKFRMNVDGIAGTEVKGVFIKGNDSIYVFMDVTVDPDQPVSISPFVIEEYVTVSSNGSEKDILLEAWGQNANYVPGSNRKGVLSLLSCDLGTETWDDPKPYVIYGVLFIDSCELILPAGTDVYVHGGLVRDDSLLYNDGFLIVLENGKITANGTADEPITFQGDRLEQSFDDLAGQWVGIRFISGSIGNRFEHVNIKNSVVGMRIDSAAQLSLESCSIFNTSSAGLIGIRADIDATNTLIYNNGQNCALLTYGGNYNFNHCTFASYGNQSSAVRFDNFRCTDPPLCQEVVFVNQLNASFSNCIFAGNEKDEIFPIDWTDGTEPDLFNFDLKNCAVTVDEILDPELFPNFFDNCEDCINLTFMDTLFLDIDNNVFSLDTMSIAIDKGFFNGLVTDDILDNARDNMPDLGCFEFQK